MIKGLLAKKIGMSQYFTEDGNAVAVTVLQAGPCVALQVKTKDKDGYTAVKLGFDEKREKLTTKPELGAFKKANTKPLRFVKEVSIASDEEIKQGQVFTAEMFQPGEYIDVIGTSIGKGFQGGMKRWNWSGGKASHGSMTHRRPGSIGASAYPSRVIKGHRMPGHMGHVRKTIQGLEIIEVDKDKNIILIKGTVPGTEGNYLIINKAKKQKIKKQKPQPEASSNDNKQQVRKPVKK